MATAAARRPVESRVAKSIISSTFFFVFENVVGFVNFLELLFGVLFPGISVGMVFHRERAICFLKRTRIRGLGNPKRLVKILLSHNVSRLLPRDASAQAVKACAETCPSLPAAIRQGSFYRR